MPVTAEQINLLQESVFRSSESHSSTVGKFEKGLNPLLSRVQIISLPGDKATQESYMRAFHLYLIVAGTSDSTDARRWRNYVVTLTCACFSNMREDLLANPLHEDKPMSEASVTALMQWYTMYRGALAPDADDAVRASCAEDLPGLYPDLDLPLGTASTRIDIDHVLDIPSIYGHFSLVLFLAGKTITEKNRSSITQKRPAAIERKYFGGTPVASLSGSLALSSAAHTQIHAAFVYLGHARKIIFQQVALFNTQDGNPQVEIVATTTRLMRFAGMQQAILIDRWLLAHPEGFRVPLLVPSIQHYVASLKELQKLPSEQRPYFKLINGDTTRAFNRNDLEYVLAVALSEEREINPTLKQYAIPPNFQIICQRYDESVAVLEAKEEE